MCAPIISLFFSMCSISCSSISLAHIQQSTVDAFQFFIISLLRCIWTVNKKRGQRATLSWQHRIDTMPRESNFIENLWSFVLFHLWIFTVASAHTRSLARLNARALWTSPIYLIISIGEKFVKVCVRDTLDTYRESTQLSESVEQTTHKVYRLNSRVGRRHIEQLISHWKLKQSEKRGNYQFAYRGQTRVSEREWEKIKKNKIDWRDLSQRVDVNIQQNWLIRWKMWCFSSLISNLKWCLSCYIERVDRVIDIG